MAGSKETSKKSEREPENDIFLIVLYAPDRETFAALFRQELLDVGPIHGVPDSEEIEVHIYADELQIGRLRKQGWRLDVRDNLTETGKKRQCEVGKGDRFEGGKVPPKGLGKKTGAEDEK